VAGNTPITVAYGDGIGPEIMEASLHILKEAGARLDIETIDVGEKVYLRGITSGIEDSAWESLRPVHRDEAPWHGRGGRP
jgi:isocitrate dehydrogenase